MKLEKLRIYRARNRWLEGVFSRNPVFVRGLALPFAIMITSDLRQGAVVSLLSACSLIPCILLACSVGRRLPKWIMLAVCALLTMTIVMALLPVVSTLLPGITDSLGIYVPILSLNSMMSFLCLRHRQDLRPVLALADAVTYSVGFAFALCLIAFLRELFGANTVWGIPVQLPVKMAGLQIAFAGFLVTALLCAFFRAAGRCIRGRLYRRANLSSGKEASMP